MTNKAEPRVYNVIGIALDRTREGFIEVIEKTYYDSLLESLILAKKQRDGLHVEANKLAEALEYISEDNCSYCSECAACGSQHKPTAKEAFTAWREFNDK